MESVTKFKLFHSMLMFFGKSMNQSLFSSAIVKLSDVLDNI